MHALGPTPSDQEIVAAKPIGGTRKGNGMQRDDHVGLQQHVLFLSERRTFDQIIPLAMGEDAALGLVSVAYPEIVVGSENVAGAGAGFGEARSKFLGLQRDIPHFEQFLGRLS
jgi:hypothetical protein